MKLGKNIAKYRKERNLTQTRLADMLGVSFQAVSKWENGNSMPDILLLPKLAAVLNISCDILIGHYPAVLSSPYDELYQSPEYYWGTQPTTLSMKVLSFYPPMSSPSLLDIGCREGQNVLFFGRNGYRAEFICASIENYLPRHNFDIVFCDDMLHLLPPDSRLQLLKECKKFTQPGGIHVMNVPVEKPFLTYKYGIQKAYPWHSGELFTIYSDWEILEGGETGKMPMGHGGEERIYNYLVARKREGKGI